MREPLEIKIDTKEIVDAIQKMPQFQKTANREIRRATTENITYAQQFVQKYPPPPPSGSFQFVSERQRRWFFGALHRGEIQVPYVRTTTLGKRWTHALHSFSQGVRATLTNPTEYMPYVQDETQQARIHKGRWPTIQMLTCAPVKKFRLQYVKALKRLGDRMASSLRK